MNNGLPSGRGTLLTADPTRADRRGGTTNSAMAETATTCGAAAADTVVMNRNRMVHADPGSGMNIVHAAITTSKN